MMGPTDSRTMAEKLVEKNGVTFYRINSNKFKTTRIDLFYVDSLSKERASGNALLPAIMKRGCTSYPDLRKLENKLEELYGADLGGGVTKKGEMQFIGFHVSHINDRYTLGNEKLFDKCGELLLDIIRKPLLEGNGFKKSIFSQERDNMISFIRSRIDDKMRFSFSRLIEEMCENEPYAIAEDGSEEDALLLTPENTYKLYEEMIKSYPAYVYISGEVDDSSVQRFIDEFLSIERSDVRALNKTEISKKIDQVKRVDQSMQINQGKLCMGFRTNIDPKSDDYFSLVVFNGILGGDAHSKLFQNVREKESLAYYAQSVLEKYKGIMVIMSGIEGEKRSRAEEIILKQVEDMKQGNITEEEINATKSAILTGIKSMQDGQGAIVDFFMSQHLTESGEDFESMAEKISKVTLEDVIRISQNIELDTVYFLKPNISENESEGN